MADAEQGTAAQPKQVIPPYVSYKTFKAFLESLKVAIPSRIDRSVMPTQSGAGQAQILHALKYFELIGANGHPKETLQKLVHSEGPEREAILKELVHAHYPMLFGDGFDLSKASSSQLAEQLGGSGETVRKCIAFLMPLLKEAGIGLSPHIKGAPKRNGTSSGKRRRPSTPAEAGGAPPPPPPPPPAPQAVGWSELLLSKFPSFDPTWTDEVKKQWFEGFDKLMTTGNAAKAAGSS